MKTILKEIYQSIDFLLGTIELLMLKLNEKVL